MEKCGGAGSPGHDVAATALSLLGFLGAGYNHLTVETYVDPVSQKTVTWGESIRKGLEWLLRAQDVGGRFVNEGRDFNPYAHAFAALVMMENYGLTSDERSKISAERAANFILATSRGGWGPTEQGEERETLLTSLCCMVLAAASWTGYELDPQDFDGALSWIEKVTDASSGRSGFSEVGSPLFPFPGSPAFSDEFETATAAALVVRVAAGGTRSDAAIAAGVRRLLSNMPKVDDERSDELYVFLGTLALYQVDGPSGADWKPWNEAMKASLTRSQRQVKTECQGGSWNPYVDRWSFCQGRVCSTAIRVLTLETYYRNEPGRLRKRK